MNAQLFVLIAGIIVLAIGVAAVVFAFARVRRQATATAPAPVPVPAPAPVRNMGAALNGLHTAADAKSVEAVDAVATAVAALTVTVSGPAAATATAPEPDEAATRGALDEAIQASARARLKALLETL